MKINMNPKNRLRLILGVATLALLPVGSNLNVAQARPDDHRGLFEKHRDDRKNDDWKDRRDQDRKDDWKKNDWKKNDSKRDHNKWNNHYETPSRQKDDYYDTHYRNGKTIPYVTRYRTVRDHNGHKHREAYRVFVR